ncbi:hypothetical protein [Massilia aquatica]|uniref:Uncharacterized protein n=1 Tax=Massilia aquatica TaxID=2609000 RepID=A0ABX0LWB2_9BURK|nr:hypothetical protein [Massilia aquatica]NHZ39065.1 hypothetical protein [Massilia aquatica]
MRRAAWLDTNLSGNSGDTQSKLAACTEAAPQASASDGKILLRAIDVSGEVENVDRRPSSNISARTLTIFTKKIHV